MGFLQTGSTEMQVYLTDYGKEQILSKKFTPAYFTLNDADVNYLTSTTITKVVADISGDYDDCAFALSKWRTVRAPIIKKIVTGVSNEPQPVITID